MMAEPKTKADRVQQLFPWLWHWTIADERIGNFRSDAFAVSTPDGVVVIDALPLTETAMTVLRDVCAVIMTHGNHQRSAWRFRRELGVPVYAPSDVRNLDEEPDVLFEEGAPLPGGLQAIGARGFTDACYLVYTHEDGTGVLFCGDLICHYPGEAYRFPVEPSYFDPVGGQADARRLLDLPLTVMCAAHAEPSLYGCKQALQEAIKRVAETGQVGRRSGQVSDSAS